MIKPGPRSLRLPLPRTHRARLFAGIALLFAGLLVFAAGRLTASSGHHAYDEGARPPASVHLTKGVRYQLSVPGGVPALRKRGLLTSTNKPYCTRGEGASQQQLILDNFRDDDRDLTVFASFVADRTGSFAVKCLGVDAVFVDDADSSSFDYSGLSVLVSSILLAAGIALAASGAYALSSEREAYESPAADPASAADTSSN